MTRTIEQLPFTLDQIVENPLKLVDHVFNAKQSINPSGNQSSQSVDLGISSIIQERFQLPASLSFDGSQSASNRSIIPSLNVIDQSNNQSINQSVKQGSLIRFRGRVCDTYNPELYCSVYHYIDDSSVNQSIDQPLNQSTNQSINQSLNRGTGLYRDVIEVAAGQRIDFSHPQTKRSERLTVRMTPIPGEAPWVQRLIDGNQSINQSISQIAASQPANGTVDDRSSRKRALETDEPMEDVDDSVEPAKHTRSVPANGSINQSINQLPMDQNSVLVTLYDSAISRLKVGDLVEVIGVYSFTPALMREDDDDIPEDIVDLYAFPRIHSISLLPIDCSIQNEANVTADSIKAARDGLLKRINDSCMGDELMSELMLLGMLSHVHVRSPQPIGPLSINLHCEDHAKPVLSSIDQLLRSLYVSTISVPLTVDALNSRPFIPTKDYTTDRLSSALLASQKHTAFLFDETQLSEGQLSQIGAENVRFCQSMMDNQTLSCDFKYHVLELPSDCNHFTVSQKPSILTHMMRIKHQPSINQPHNQPINELDTSIIDAHRRYLTWCRSLPFSIPEQFTSLVESSFIARRKADSSIKAEWLHEVLGVARWLALSHGEKELTQARWEHAIKLVDMRRERM